MPRYLLTPTLLNSFQYYKGYEGDHEPLIYEDFLRTLAREPSEPTEAMMKGIEFEHKIYQVTTKAGPSDEKVVNELAEVVDSGMWQQSVKKELSHNNMDLLLYGRTDVIKQDYVYDIKFTKNYAFPKFLDSAQHLVYLYCSQLPKFSYLISNGTEWWREDYDNSDEVLELLRTKIDDFLNFLETDHRAKSLYFNQWEADK